MKLAIDHDKCVLVKDDIIFDADYNIKGVGASQLYFVNEENIKRIAKTEGLAPCLGTMLSMAIRNLDDDLFEHAMKLGDQVLDIIITGPKNE